MSKDIDYTLAFPTPESRDSGMHLRDYFAAMALQGLLANSNITNQGMDGEAQWYAREAYRAADHMMIQRQKELDYELPESQ